MNNVILVAVNDSPAGFAAADVAVEYARRLGDHLHVVCVAEPESLVLATQRAASVPHSERTAEADAMLKHVANRSARAGVEVTTHRRSGAVAAEILAASIELDAGLLVLALVDRPNHTIPYIGSQTLRVLEFATMPVLVVPTAISGR